MDNALAERLKQADKNGDGKLSKEEAPDRLKENFDRLDTNKDGFLDAAEMRQMFERRPGAGENPPRRPGTEPPKTDPPKAEPPKTDNDK